MAEFDYNPFVESLHITFLCPHCNGANTEDIIVPTPDWLAESHHDSINSDTLDLQCAHCGNEIKIDLATGIYGGEGYIPKVKKIIDIQEEYPVDDYYDGQLFKSTYDETINTLDRIESLDETTKDVLYKLLYANLITKMEAFLSDTLKQEVFATEESKRKFVENYADFKKRKMSLNEIYRQFNDIDIIILTSLNNIIYHNLNKVKAIYNSTINVDIGNIQELSKAVKTRHDIVHRNGRDKDGNIHAISREDIIALANSVSSFIERIEKNRPFFQAGKSLPF